MRKTSLIYSNIPLHREKFHCPVSSCYKPSPLPETPINVITLPGSFFLFKTVFYYLHLDRPGFVSRTEWRCALACVCVCGQKKCVWGGCFFFFSKTKKPCPSSTSCPHLFKNGKTILCEMLGVQVERKTSPYKGEAERPTGVQECRHKLSFWQDMMGNRSMFLLFLLAGGVSAPGCCF